MVLLKKLQSSEIIYSMNTSMNGLRKNISLNWIHNHMIEIVPNLEDRFDGPSCWNRCENVVCKSLWLGKLCVFAVNCKLNRRQSRKQHRLAMCIQPECKKPDRLPGSGKLALPTHGCRKSPKLDNRRYKTSNHQNCTYNCSNDQPRTPEISSCTN